MAKNNPSSDISYFKNLDGFRFFCFLSVPCTILVVMYNIARYKMHHRMPRASKHICCAPEMVGIASNMFLMAGFLASRLPLSR